MCASDPRPASVRAIETRKPHVRHRIHGVHAHLHHARVPHDPRPGVLLRRAGAAQERRQHHAHVPCGRRRRRRAVGGRGLVARLRRGRLAVLHRRARPAARPADRLRPARRGVRPAGGRDLSLRGGRRLPDGLRHDHGGHRDRVARRARALRVRHGVFGRVGARGLRAARAHGLGRGGVADRRRHRRARFRRGRRGPHLVGRHRPHPVPARRRPPRVRPAELPPAQRSVRHAGGGAAVVRLVRVQRGLGLRRRRDRRARDPEHGDRGSPPGWSSSASRPASPPS